MAYIVFGPLDSKQITIQYEPRSITLHNKINQNKSRINKKKTDPNKHWEKKQLWQKKEMELFIMMELILHAAKEEWMRQ